MKLICKSKLSKQIKESELIELYEPVKLYKASVYIHRTKRWRRRFLMKRLMQRVYSGDWAEA